MCIRHDYRFTCFGWLECTVCHAVIRSSVRYSDMPWINAENEADCSGCDSRVAVNEVVWCDFDMNEVYCGNCGEAARVEAEKRGSTVHEAGCTCGFCKMGYTNA